ncbi:MAG: phosphodiester glycosidase family protein [Nostoc sp. DedVER02]|uniref:phosphodiester glycosidase family protein n=1 Tax=unclassified Nostoc TaxID=2593658 RepID=UPI002AD2F2CD|nr:MULTISPECIES: phosphodiester glycosidase family protein [unclassified Nostoc]MDZ7989578.1 phosphodiester glycosidase family protein [Nostoc sp. DedVER02]MDZ8116095.1 phosphodiester glycosidase family protein [Nostoc sp. DedVER01b]
MNVVINLLLFLLPILSSLWIAQTFNPLSSYQPLQSIEGAALYKKELTNGNEAYLQIIDLRKMEIDQIIGEVDNMGLNEGKYYKGEGKYYSPFFKQKLFSEVTDEYKKLYANNVFSIINCSFFEQYQSSSQLSFPIKLNGVVITGGTSPYGPIKEPKDKYYSNIRLKTLVWDNKQAYITDYNQASGSPLNQNGVKNAIVTYSYSDHPAKVLAQNQVNKYQVIGTLDKDGLKGNELLLIMTVKQATLDEAADLLRKLGVKGDIITVDGGRSTYLFNSQNGNIIVPQQSNLQENPTFRYLPHYLGFRKKTKNQVAPKISISQPAKKVLPKKDQPYLILWRDNLNGDVSIKLYDGDKLIQNISSRTASDGVYEWIPRISLKEGYSIRISSWNNRNIFGQLQF